MKKRERNPQKQSSRLYLRRHDHRDAIMNGLYHNALIWKDEDGVEELIWKKYAQHACLIGNNGQGGVIQASGCLASMDLDRQWQGGMQIAGGDRRLFQYVFDDYVMIFDDYNNPHYYATKDGMELNNIHGNPLVVHGTQATNAYAYYFGHDSICAIYSQGTGIYRVDVTKAEYDENTKTWEFVNDSFTLFYDRSEIAYLFNTYDGMILRERTTSSDAQGNYFYDDMYVKISADGSRTELRTEMNTYRDLFPATYSNMVSARNGQFCGMVGYDRLSHNRFIVDKTCRVVVSTTIDGGLTFNHFQLDAVDMGYGDPQIFCDLFASNGAFFVFVATSWTDNFACKLYMSTGGITWTELALPSYLEIPYVQEPSTCVQFTYDEYLKVAVKPLFVEEYDTRLCDLVGGGHHNCFFKDGERGEEGFNLVLGNPLGICAYFDNAYLQITDRTFAWNGCLWRDSNSIPDYVQEDDYCVRGGTVIPFWNPYTQYFPNDLVMYGIKWKCKVANTNQIPQEGTYWTRGE